MTIRGACCPRQSRRLGDPDQARQGLCAALCMAAAKAMGTQPIHMLPPLALFLAEEGPAELAVEVYALACRYPLHHQLALVSGCVRLAPRRRRRSLAPEVVAAAQARDLQATVRELLAQL